MPYHENQKQLFPEAQIESMSTSLDTPSRQVDFNIAPRERRFRPILPTSHHSHASEEFCKCKGFTEVVVSPAVESGDPIRDAFPSGQEQHRSRLIPFAEALQQGQAVRAWQPPIEKHNVPLGIAELLPAFVAVSRAAYGKALFAKTAHNEVSNFGIVLHKQDFCVHRHSYPSTPAE
jgi:hypothetical protein